MKFKSICYTITINNNYIYQLFEPFKTTFKTTFTMFIYNIPVSSSQISSIAGRKGLKIGCIKAKYGVQINLVDNNYSKHPLPYFIIQGNENQVNKCVIEIQRLIILSLTR